VSRRRSVRTPAPATASLRAQQGAPGDAHPQVVERRDRGRHQPLPARLVEGPGPPLPDGHVEPGPRAVQGGDEPDGAAADDEDSGHRTGAGDDDGDPGTAASSARFSTRSRTVSNAAFATVKTPAVSHAVCTNGSATPSTTTAT
jgi:hypothetical protein